MADLFYLEDSRSNTGSRAMFWKLGGGYTSHLGEAELFTRERAVKQYECRDTDLPWPQPYINARAEIGVDSQYLNQAEAAAMLSTDGRIYVAYARAWDGNDLVWESLAGKPTSNLREAIRPTADSAEYYQGRGFEIWKDDYIDAKSRQVVRHNLLDHKKALREVGLKLPKIKRQRIRRYTVKCDGCGRFLNELQRYHSCPNCGAGNAP